MATKKKYQRIFVDNQESEENVIRVKNCFFSSNYVRRVLWLFQGTREENQPPAFDTVIHNAITKVIIISEVVRRRIAGLYQLNTIKQIEIKEVYYPFEEGLVAILMKRKLASLQIKLTKTSTEQEKNQDFIYQYQNQIKGAFTI